MDKRKKLSLGIAIAVAVSGLFLLLKPDHNTSSALKISSSDKPLVGEASADEKPLVLPAEAQVNRDSHRKSLSSNFPPIEESQAPPAQDGTELHTTPEKPLAAAQADYIQSIKTLNQTAQQHGELMSILGLEMGEEELKYITDSFIVEPVDEDWAPQYEKQINRSILEDAELSGITLKSIQCRSSRCLVEINSDELDNFMELREILFKQVISEKNGFKVGTFWSYFSLQENLGTIVIGRNPRVMILDGSKL